MIVGFLFVLNFFVRHLVALWSSAGKYKIQHKSIYCHLSPYLEITAFLLSYFASCAVFTLFLSHFRGWLGEAKVLGKVSVPGRPTSLDYSKARACCAFRRCGWGLFGHFFSRLSISPLSPSLWETARYRLKYCLKGPLSPKQPTNQPFSFDVVFSHLLCSQEYGILSKHEFIHYHLPHRIPQDNQRD